MIGLAVRLFMLQKQGVGLHGMNQNILFVKTGISAKSSSNFSEVIILTLCLSPCIKVTLRLTNRTSVVYSGALCLMLAPQQFH